MNLTGKGCFLVFEHNYAAVFPLIYFDWSSFHESLGYLYRRKSGKSKEHKQLRGLKDLRISNCDVVKKNRQFKQEDNFE